MPQYRLGDHSITLPADGSVWIAPSADVIGHVVLGRSTSIWFGAVIRADNTPIQIDDRTNVQDGAVLHSDPGFPLTIGQDVTVGHRAILHGCTIGNRVIIGMGAIVLNGAVIGDDTIIGAGSLVTGGKSFPPNSLITGSPAIRKRDLSPAELISINQNSNLYVDNSLRFDFGLTMFRTP